MLRQLLISLAVVVLLCVGETPAWSQQSGIPQYMVTDHQVAAPEPATNGTNAPAAAAPKPDSQLIAAGQIAFSNSCLSCHDANKSLAKRKSLSQWRSTVQRMATKDGAEVAAGDVEAIATYLASLGGGETATAGGASQGEASITVFGTISPTWRGGSDDLQNGGFFPDAWVGVNVQTGTALSGRVTSCVSCHAEAGEGSRLELVDAVLRLDLNRAMNPCCADPLIKASVEAGRFVVPFGAFAQQSNPGVYRTVSKPLIYNMGLRVRDGDLGDPVLPMPYSDEGAVLSTGALVAGDVYVNWDAYAINGLWAEVSGIDFDLSRDYVDNNNQPAVGTRVTLGNQMLKAGGSVMSGQSSPTGGLGVAGRDFNYLIYGYDAVFRYEDILRVQFEFARRDSDRIVGDPVQIFTRDRVLGYYLESELLLSRDHGVSLLARYDRQNRHSIAPPPESVLPNGSFDVSRFTYGLNFTLAGGSTLMINHERWFLPAGQNRIDVIGVRWACSF